MIHIYAVPVLGGAYKGKDLGERRLLKHAVADQDIHIGRLKRDEGEAFCTKNLPGLSDDTYHRESPDNISCPKCLEIVERLKASPQGSSIVTTSKSAAQLDREIDEAVERHRTEAALKAALRRSGES